MRDHLRPVNIFWESQAQGLWPLVRRYAATDRERLVRSERLREVCRGLRPGRRASSILRWVVSESEFRRDFHQVLPTRKVHQVKPSFWRPK